MRERTDSLQTGVDLTLEVAPPATTEPARSSLTRAHESGEHVGSCGLLDLVAGRRSFAASPVVPLTEEGHLDQGP